MVNLINKVHLLKASCLFVNVIHQKTDEHYVKVLKIVDAKFDVIYSSFSYSLSTQHLTAEYIILSGGSKKKKEQNGSRNMIKKHFTFLSLPSFCHIFTVFFEFDVFLRENRSSSRPDGSSPSRLVDEKFHFIIFLFLPHPTGHYIRKALNFVLTVLRKELMDQQKNLPIECFLSPFKCWNNSSSLRA